MKKILLSLLLVLIPLNLMAHPHVFIDSQTTFVFDNNGLSAIDVRWVFDEMFGATFIMDYDANANGVLEKNEVATIKEEAFDYLKNFGYFTHINIDGRPFKVQFVTKFNAINEDGQLVYSFTIPCHVRASHTPKKISLAIYDESYYTQIDCQPGRIKDSRFSATIKQQRNPGLSYYNGMIVPEETVLDLRLR
ncbi:MAG: DUF1007 family protein [Thermodesulfobacteriota bacterium]|nr:DUF1007 family protein [Thermodesulfobacteriota bacterium]